MNKCKKQLMVQFSQLQLFFVELIAASAGFYPEVGFEVFAKAFINDRKKLSRA